MIQLSKHKTALSDEDLIKAYKVDDDPTHVAALYGKYIELVKGLCLKYLKNGSDSDDAVMEIYELLVKKLKTHEVEHFKSWLYILSKNHCLGKLRENKKKSDWENDYLTTAHESSSFHPFEEDVKEQMLNKMEDCLEKLIDTQKVCVTRFYIKKESYKEISTSMSMSWNRVRSLIQNGRRNLKICIEQS